MAGLCGRNHSWFSKRFLPQDGLAYYFDADNVDCYTQGSQTANNFNGNYTNIPTGVLFSKTNIGSTLLLKDNTLSVNATEYFKSIIFPITMGIWIKGGMSNTHNAFMFDGFTYYGPTFTKSLRVDSGGPRLVYLTSNKDTTVTSIGHPTNISTTNYNFYTISISGTRTNPQTTMGINTNFFTGNSTSWSNLSPSGITDTPDPTLTCQINGYANGGWRISPSDPVNLGIIFVYDKALTISQLSGIYNLTRLRYGV